MEVTLKYSFRQRDSSPISLKMRKNKTDTVFKKAEIVIRGDAMRYQLLVWYLFSSVRTFSSVRRREHIV